MNIAPVQFKSATADVPIESLAGDKDLSENEKISIASKQFEALLLRQILSETQKPVIQSEFTDNSTASGIYQDMITSQLADSLSKSDAIGLAKTFEQQLTHPGANNKHFSEHNSTSISKP